MLGFVGVRVWELVLYRVYVSVTMIQNIKVKNICIVSQTESLKILVHMAIPMCTTCARGYSHGHNTWIFGLHFCALGLATCMCAWLCHAHVYSIQNRFLGTSRTDSNYQVDIFTGNICPYHDYLSCYWPDFAETLKVGSCEHLEQIPTVRVTFVHVTFVLATFVHIRNISAVTNPILMKL